MMMIKTEYILKSSSHLVLIWLWGPFTSCYALNQTNERNTQKIHTANQLKSIFNTKPRVYVNNNEVKQLWMWARDGREHRL